MKVKQIYAIILSAIVILVAAGKSFANEPWEMSGLTRQEKAIMKDILSISPDSYVVAFEVSDKGSLNNVLHVILDFICGNHYVQDVASGIKVEQYSDRLDVSASSNTWSTIKNAGSLYNQNYSRVMELLQTEAGIVGTESSIDIVTKINHWMCYSFSYDEPSYSNSVQQTLQTRRGVCGQFSQIFKYACDCFGIPCDLIVSYQMTHAYNRVKINGKNFM